MKIKDLFEDLLDAGDDFVSGKSKKRMVKKFKSKAKDELEDWIDDVVKVKRKLWSGSDQSETKSRKKQRSDKKRPKDGTLSKQKNLGRSAKRDIKASSQTGRNRRGRAGMASRGFETISVDQSKQKTPESKAKTPRWSGSL